MPTHAAALCLQQAWCGQATGGWNRLGGPVRREGPQPGGEWSGGVVSLYGQALPVVISLSLLLLTRRLGWHCDSQAAALLLPACPSYYHALPYYAWVCCLQHMKRRKDKEGSSEKHVKSMGSKRQGKRVQITLMNGGHCRRKEEEKGMPAAV